MFSTNKNLEEHAKIRLSLEEFSREQEFVPGFVSHIDLVPGQRYTLGHCFVKHSDPNSINVHFDHHHIAPVQFGIYLPTDIEMDCYSKRGILIDDLNIDSHARINFSSSYPHNFQEKHPLLTGVLKSVKDFEKRRVFSHGGTIMLSPGDSLSYNSLVLKVD